MHRSTDTAADGARPPYRRAVRVDNYRFNVGIVAVVEDKQISSQRRCIINNVREICTKLANRCTVWRRDRQSVDDGDNDTMAIITNRSTKWPLTTSATRPAAPSNDKRRLYRQRCPKHDVACDRWLQFITYPHLRQQSAASGDGC